jgi:hypothetical protein
MNGAPTAITTASAAIKSSAVGKKGNVGGITTPGRKGMGSALHMLVKPGSATTKTAKPANLHRPEGAVHIDAGNVKKSGKASLAGGTAGGAASKAVQIGAKVTAKGHKGIHIGTRPEGAVKRDASRVLKPNVVKE